MMPLAGDDAAGTARWKPGVMHQIERIVERVSGAMGPDADPADVEAVVSSLLEASGTHGLITGFALHISLTDCSSLLTNTVRSRSYDKIRRIASHAAAALHEASISGRVYLATTPLTRVAAKASASDLILLARMLDDAAADCSASEVEGLSASAERGVAGTAAALISASPDVLQATTRVSIDIRPASRRGKLNTDAVAHVVAAARRFSGPREDLLRLGLRSGSAIEVPSADAAIFLRADARRLIDAALGAAPMGNLQEIEDILTATAFGVGRRAARQGEVAATILSHRSGLDIRFGGIEVDARTGSMDDLAVQASFASAIALGFRAAARQSYVLPQRFVAAFTNATSNAAAGARIVDELARSAGTAVSLHAIFSDSEAGDRIRVGPFPDVVVNAPPDRAWFSRGGRISTRGGQSN